MPKSASPLWATPERKAKLIELWSEFGNKCLLGHSACPNPDHYIRLVPETVTTAQPVRLPCEDSNGNPIRTPEGERLYFTIYQPVKNTIYRPEYWRLYDYKAEQAIDNWKADDGQLRQLEAELEAIRLHSLAEPRQPLRGRFSAISRDIWQSSQPLYYIEGLGISGLTLKPFVRVRLSSSYMRLYVNLGDTLRGVSKSRKRKAIRYGKRLPLSVEETINLLVRESVTDYLHC